MDHQVLVRIFHRLAHLEEQPQPLGDALAAGGGVGGDRHAFDELHGEVRDAVVAGAAVEQPGDVRMLEPRQDLTFVAEALEELGRPRREGRHLEGDALGERAVVALGLEHHAHSAAADLADHPVGPEACAGGLRLV